MLGLRGCIDSFLFIGIALLVYHLAFKVLGIILFAIEIYWFIMLPIIKEVKNWYMPEIRNENEFKQTVRTIGILFIFLLSMFAFLTVEIIA